MKKTIFTLNVDGYAPEIIELTYPLLRYYANKIGADFYIIDKRKFKDYPVTYEKLQIYELGQEMQNDWNIYIDSDALIHPETLDWTYYLRKDTVIHNGNDMANIRWRFDKYFLRDGRNFGSCNWFTIASDWCIDLWRPLEITAKEAISNIFPTVEELNTVITPEHLIDDYALSRNIAKYGLKATTCNQIQKDFGFADAYFHWHDYTHTVEQKINGWREMKFDEKQGKMIEVEMHGIKGILDTWKVPKNIREYAK